MLFGTKETFAIETMSEPDLKPPSAVWGRMQIWCEGVSIGDFSDPYCALYVSYLSFKDLNKKFSQLWKIEFAGLSDVEILRHLDYLLYGCHNDIEIEDKRSTEECQRDWNKYGMFNFLTNWGEQFDRAGKYFIVCTPAQRVRVLSWEAPSALEASVSQVSTAIQGFLRWFEEEAARLGNPVT